MGALPLTQRAAISPHHRRGRSVGCLPPRCPNPPSGRSSLMRLVDINLLDVIPRGRRADWVFIGGKLG